MLTDIRHAFRLLGRSPWFTLAAVATPALGIGATTAIFTLVEAILLRPLPIAEPHRVVTVHVQEPTRLTRGFTYPAFLRFRDAAGQVFEAIAGSGDRGFSVTVGDDTRLASAAFVTEEYFEVTGIRMARGRSFLSEEHRPGADLVVVATDAFWRSRMDADPGVVGRQIRVADKLATIVGVAPRRFRGLELASPADMFVPLAAAPLVLPPANYFSDRAIRFSPQAWIEQRGGCAPAYRSCRQKPRCPWCPWRGPRRDGRGRFGCSRRPTRHCRHVRRGRRPASQPFWRRS